MSALHGAVLGDGTGPFGVLGDGTGPFGVLGDGTGPFGVLGQLVTRRVDGTTGDPAGGRGQLVTPARGRAEGRADNVDALRSGAYPPGCRRLLMPATSVSLRSDGHLSVFDLRPWIIAAEQAGELEYVSGASADLEIGAASQLNYRRKRPRALVFDDIPGYQRGQRVLTSSLASPSLMGMSLGLGAGLSDSALVESLRGRPTAWREEAARRAATRVSSGPVFDNVLAKQDIPMREIAQSIGDHLGLPAESIPADRLQAYYGPFLAMVITHDGPTSSLATRRILGWQPAHPGLLADFNKGEYFTTTTATADNR
jgi:hypothetical protein